MSLTPDIERVQEWDDFLAEHGLPMQSGRNLGQYRVEWECDCGATFIADGHRGETAFDMHQRHLAEQIAALVEQAEGDHLAAFLAQLPGDLFSETEIQRVREWAGEWSG